MEIDILDKFANLQEYKDAVRYLALTNSRLIFPNTGIEHAAVVLENIINFSDEKVSICDENLDGDVSERSSTFMESLEVFAYSGKTLQIVIANQGDFECQIFKTLQVLMAKFPQTVLVRRPSLEFKALMKKIAKELLGTDSDHINFAVGDNKSFRLEGDNKRKAFCCFNNTEYALKLDSIFKNSFASCLPYFERSMAH